MDPIFAAERILLLRGVVMLGGLSFAVAVCLAVLLGAVRPVSRRVFRRLRRAQAEVRRLREVIAAQADRMKDLEREAHRLDALRRRADEGCARKNAELDEALTDLATLRKLIEHLRTPAAPLRRSA